jgi:hypothetical protein
MDQWVALSLAAMIGAWVSIFLTVTLPYIFGIVFYDSTKIDGQTKPRSSSLQS